MAYYLFDPLQLKEYGRSFFQGEGFSYRYQLSKKMFWKSVYIPWGPVCDSANGFKNFLAHIDAQKFTHTTIELPIIYDLKMANKIVDDLIANGFKKLNFTMQSDETLLIIKDRFHLPSAKMNKVRAGKRYADVEVKNVLDESEVDEIYSVYLIAISRLNAKPVSKDVFIRLSKNCLVSLAKNKETKKLEGYAFGYLTDFGPSDYTNKMNNKIMTVVYTGLTDEGRDRRLGHYLHYELFNVGFESFDIDIINFHGASRTKNHSFLPFKLDFTDQFHKLPGCYDKKRWF